MRRTRRRLAADTPFATYYYIVQGRQKGPVCLVTGGIHGREVAGILAAKRLCGARIKKGTLIVVPVVNVKAYQNRTRGCPGCPDLNRTFPYRASEKPRHPLAAALFRLVRTSRPALCLDLHEATGFSRINQAKLGQSLINYPKSASVRMSKRVTRRINRSIASPSKRFTVTQRILPGSFRTAVARLLGCPAVTVETSMNLPLADRVRYQMRIVRYFLRETGLM